MNELLGRLDESLRRQRAFVADAGHELRTPFAVMQGELELAARPGRNPEEISARARQGLGGGRSSDQACQRSPASSAKRRGTARASS